MGAHLDTEGGGEVPVRGYIQVYTPWQTVGDIACLPKETVGGGGDGNGSYHI